MPKVSVIVPVYNSGYYIRKCLESIKDQTLKDIEVILINDGSTDNSGVICDEYVSLDKRFRVIHKKNEGISTTRNIGITEAKGLFIGWVDSDDYIEPTMYEELYNKITEEKADFCYCNFSIINNNIKTEQYTESNNYCKDNMSLLSLHLKADYTSLCNTLVKKEIYDINNIRCTEKLNYAEDLYVSSLLILNSKKIAFVQSSLYNYIKHNSSYTTQNISKWEGTNEKIINCKNLIKIFNSRNLNKNYIELLNFRILKAKRQVVFGDTSFKNLQLDRFNEIDTESSKYIFLEKNVPFKIKIQEYFLSKKIFLPTQLFKFYIKTRNANYNLFFNNLLVDHVKTYPIVLKNGLNKSPRPKQVIVTLTSYKKRINSVERTIRSLLNQKEKPDKIILWLSREEFPKKEKELPQKLLRLCNYGLTINWVDKDIKSYKKFIPAIKQFKDSILAIADDDIIYSKNWLSYLYASYIKHPNLINGVYGHKIRLNTEGFIAKYTSWERYLNNQFPSYTNLCLTGYGTIFSPKILYRDIIDESLFLSLSPTADDLWLWAMSVVNGTKINILHSKEVLFKEQNVSDDKLYQINILSGNNDIQIGRLTNKYPQIMRNLNDEINNIKQ